MGLNIISERPFIKGGCSVLKSGAYSDTVSNKGEGVPLHSLSKHREEPLHEAPRPSYMFHCDTAGPFRSSTKGGNQYLEVKIDAHSGFIFGAMERTIGAFHENFKHFVKRVEAEFGREGVIAQLLADSATYYEKSIPLANFCRQKGIVQLFSPPYTQSLNSIAERNIRTIVEMARSMMLQAGVPRHLYGEAMMYAIYILNRLPHKAGSTTTRLEKWTSRVIPLAHKSIREFGCAAWVHQAHPTKNPQPDKLKAKAIRQIMLGINERRQCYRLGSLPYFGITHSAHVIFNEDDYSCKPGGASNDSDFMPAALGPVRTASEPQELPSRPQRQWAPSAAALLRIADQDASPPDESPSSEEADDAAMHVVDSVCSEFGLYYLDHVYNMADMDSDPPATTTSPCSEQKPSCGAPLS